ncbi:2-succinyl-5-enolpyruvyl-6-hydroxy-3-cyclohexene-1-carboxylic-acid synthase [Thermaerobacter sp. PB12/4term]|uniref:2-succinyl-5-enolpyruvyl-6-hydroxy-3- cyclohexene-1-carboxylic-acid synthase n=1 Tax=Thermaerobacter sp. PB12/4term TaxID=2293838 RepID=UPI000E326A4E|nr:2-succinyl-5-enolpyruvyl-6-hydroxy-3-cyclohexene-1-carboxylic-acid synthase [Thermaerobacter sp. PB12/4term]QIA27483.1 2-succinyl-5-enolpyruvyl-6-hydroxy-3-cyclohexene-1-carboxylic-acid synthase [Thermaerobacter sp. PB12/4term]
MAEPVGAGPQGKREEPGAGRAGAAGGPAAGGAVAGASSVTEDAGNGSAGPAGPAGAAGPAGLAGADAPAGPGGSAGPSGLPGTIAPAVVAGPAAPPGPDLGRTNLAWALALMDGLVSAGVEHVVVCPGSRSTPLALAAARHPGVRLWVQLDERSAAFFALGLGRATGRPAAVVATSGTAPANFYPAVIEARYGRVPLVVLSADRPHELREFGASQTVDQIHLYGRHAKWFADLPLPEDDPAARAYVTRAAVRAVTEALAAPAGPVHLNVPFREPLVPEAPAASRPAGAGASSHPAAVGAAAAADAVGMVQGLAAVERGLAGGEPVGQGPPDREAVEAHLAGEGRLAGGPAQPVSGGPWQAPLTSAQPRPARRQPVEPRLGAAALTEAQAHELFGLLAGARRGLIVCGPLSPVLAVAPGVGPAAGGPGGAPAFSAEGPPLAVAVTRLARRLGLPVLADPLSGVRCGPHASAEAYGAQQAARQAGPAAGTRQGGPAAWGQQGGAAPAAQQGEAVAAGPDAAAAAGPGGGVAGGAAGNEAAGTAPGLAREAQATGEGVAQDPAEGPVAGSVQGSAQGGMQGPIPGPIIDAYDAFLRVPALASALAPDVVLRLGGMPVSKPLAQFLERHPRAVQVVIDEGGWPDPSHGAALVVRADPVQACWQLAQLAAAYCGDEPAPAGEAQPGGGQGGPGAVADTQREGAPGSETRQTAGTGVASRAGGPPAHQDEGALPGQGTAGSSTGFSSGSVPAGSVGAGGPVDPVPAPGDASRPPGAGSWLGLWQRLNHIARQAMARQLARWDEPAEPRVVAELARLLPAGSLLFAGNSMPIRDVDTFFPAGPRPVRILANRGAAGIDGVVSTAAGVAAAGEGPVVLLIGDLSFYHDLNGLWAAARYGLPLVTVVVNNDGGGIFSFLAQSRLDPAEFEPLWGTPHGLDFRHAAALYGIPYRRVDTWDAFRAAVQEALGRAPGGGGTGLPGAAGAPGERTGPADGNTPGPSIVEIRTNRQRNVDHHRQIWQAVAAALAEAGLAGEPAEAATARALEPDGHGAAAISARPAAEGRGRPDQEAPVPRPPDLLAAQAAESSTGQAAGPGTGQAGESDGGKAGEHSAGGKAGEPGAGGRAGEHGAGGQARGPGAGRTGQEPGAAPPAGGARAGFVRVRGARYYVEAEGWPLHQSGALAAAASRPGGEPATREPGRETATLPLDGDAAPSRPGDPRRPSPSGSGGPATPAVAGLAAGGGPVGAPGSAGGPSGLPEAALRAGGAPRLSELAPRSGGASRHLEPAPLLLGGDTSMLPEPALLLHGFTGSTATWAGVWSQLAAAGPLLAVDLLGHGRSAAPAGPDRYHMEEQVADLVALLDRLGIGRVHLVGYSMGGRVALSLAAAAPERVASVVLESSSPGLAGPGEREARRRSDEALARRIEEEGVGAFTRAWEELPLFAGLKDLDPAARASVRATRLAQRPRGLAGSLRGMGAGVQTPLWDRLADLPMPVLCLAGAADAKYAALARTMAGRIPRGRAVIVPGAGHTVHLEEPAAFVREVRAFWREHRF